MDVFLLNLLCLDRQFPVELVEKNTQSPDYPDISPMTLLTNRLDHQHDGT